MSDGSTYTAIGKGGPLDGRYIPNLPADGNGKPQPEITVNVGRQAVRYVHSGGVDLYRGGAPVYNCETGA